MNHTSTLSQDQETFEIYEEKPDHYYRTEIPNIIFDLGLDPISFKLYLSLKKLVGNEGYCTDSNASIGFLVGESDFIIRKHKKILAKPFLLLGNMPLIKITKRKIGNRPNETDLVTLTPIWRVSGDYLSRK